MAERLETKKFVFTVEGETEQWYFYWLRDQINACPTRTYNISVIAKVQQSPSKFYKSVNVKTTPEVTHVCDVESNEPYHVAKFLNILSEMKDAMEQKGIEYSLGYSNYAFELWMVLHKRDCNGPLAHRRQYLVPINQAFGENFEDLDHYKQEDKFKKCLSKLSLADVQEAIRRAKTITDANAANGKTLLEHRGYTYYKDNPALSIHEAVEKMMLECGVITG